MPRPQLAIPDTLREFPQRSFRFNVLLGIFLIVIAILSVTAMAYGWYQQSQTKQQQLAQYADLQVTLAETQTELTETQASLEALLNQDQYQRNEALQAEIKNIQQVYRQAVDRYEELLTLRLSLPESQPLEKLLTDALVQLSQRDYQAAQSSLASLDAEITKRQQVSVSVPDDVPAVQEAPASGYQRQSVKTEFGTYVVDVIAADLNSTRVQVETAPEGSCADNCPVSSLADFVSRSGGFAGVNGPYFCPAEYPSCVGKTNSFDTLLMNRQKTYFNSDNNVYSTVPAFVFSGNSAHLVGRSLEIGRDTNIDAVIASQPMLLSGGEVRFNGDGDPKKGSKGSRSFIGTTGSTMYIGVVRGATVAEVAYVLQAMGIQDALNLDGGGSTALLVNGKYVAGPGRNTPFGIVLVRK